MASIGPPALMAVNSFASSRSVFSISASAEAMPARPSMRRRFISCVNTSQKRANISGSTSLVRKAFRTRASNSSRRMFTRLSQVPLLRAVEQPISVAEIAE
ncbi:hypothetical protein [Rhizobium oryzihabitans]|uniref:hypothetical protein n=2 Tax=Rhizobiaceae TaxID=82115 RepID=UPI0029A5313B|nr:hypothetical protein [Shinella sp.]